MQEIRSVYSPQKQMSFVETMIPWRGHLKFRIYNSRGGGKKIKNNKNKPEYWVLVTMVCIGKSGYICNMEIHTALVYTVGVNTTNISDRDHLQLRLFGSGTTPLNCTDSW